MADRSISELPTASTIGATDLFVLQQANAAKKLTGQALENWLLQMADGHGGIQSISKTSSTGSNPIVDTYTITFADTTTSTFTVTNGIKGDTGAQTYVHVKYSAVQPTRDADIGDIPDEWMGIYIGLASVAPTHYTDYTWNKVRGEKGDTGAAAVITSQSVQYQASNSGTVIPTGTWSNSIPAVTEGQYLWTRTIVTYNSGTTTTAYSVGYKGINGTGAGDMIKSDYDPQGSVEAAGGIPAYVYGQVPSAAQQNPQMDGQANVGSSSDYARADHRHPTDTTRAKTDLSNVSNGSVKTAMLDTDSVTAPKIADGAVTRAKLAQDALYSPIRMVQSDSNVVSSDVGATIRTGGSASAITVTLTQDVSHAMPIGAEIAFLPWVAATMKIAFDGVKVGVLDRTQAYSSPTFTLKHKGMIAIKKILSDNSGDYWLLSGLTEEVTT